jgi:chromate transport protein ChrA
MRALALKLVLLTALAMFLWWPVADRYVQGPRYVTHGVFPAAFALIALLLWRMLRSFILAALCAAAVAGVVFLLYRYFGDSFRPLVEKVLR